MRYIETSDGYILYIGKQSMMNTWDLNEKYNYFDKVPWIMPYRQI